MQERERWLELYEEAMEAVRDGRVEDALARLDALIDAGPNGEADLARSARRHPEQLAAWIARAAVWRRLGLLERALESYALVIGALERLAPHEREDASQDLLIAALTNRGNVLDDRQRKEEALAHYDRALEVADFFF